MANSSMLFGPNNTSKLLQNQILTRDGALVNSNGVKNYIRNGSSELGQTTGWVVSKNTSATAAPDSGFVTSGTSNTITVSNSSPLRDNYSFVLTLAALGNQYYYDFTIDAADKGKVLQGVIEYGISSGTFADNSLAVWIYDITNAVFIQPAPYLFKNHTLTSDKLPFEFQTSSSSTSYRLVIHQAAASTAVLKVDGIFVGPQAKLYGSPITDWVSYTPTWSSNGGTPPSLGNGALTGKWRRVGDSCEYEISLSAGSTTSYGSVFSPNAYTFTLPATIDTTKTSNSGNDDLYLGTARMLRSSVTRYEGIVSYNSATTIKLLHYSTNASSASTQEPIQSNSTVYSNAPATWATGDLWRIKGSFPVLGWSSSTIMSSDAATNVITTRAQLNANATITAASTDETVILQTAPTNDLGAYSTSTGLYTVPVAGRYRVSYQARLLMGVTAATSAYTAIMKVGSAIYYAIWASDDFTLNKSYTATGSSIIECNAGDQLKLIADSTGQNITLVSSAASSDTTSMSIERISGPAQIAASETVSALYTGAPSGTLNTSFNTITMATKVKDTFGAYSAGSYPVPISGQYDIGGAIDVTHVSIALNQYVAISIFVDGVEKYTRYAFCSSTSVLEYFPQIDVKAIPLFAGQVVTLRSKTTGTTPSYISTSANSNFYINRSGNY